jgi:eukaryotic-like serine/threonine-protein kinase
VSLGIALHPALQGFRVVQETSGERGNRTLLARSKAGSLVVVKVLAERELTEEQTSQLSKLAAQSAKLGDPVIVQTRSVILERDFAAVVMEFVPGVSLQRLLRFAAGRGVRLPDSCAWYIFERLLTALAHAHANNVVHRSVSPSSIVASWDGTLKVGDFGLVQMRQVFGAAPQKSERDFAPLMSPEETKGERPDARSDVYCAALVAVRLATGRTPFARFRNVPSERILAMADGQVARLAQTRPDLPAALRDAIDAALEPDREKRTITADALLAAVRTSGEAATSKAALAKLLGRWREPLETSLTPWERRASMADDLPEEEAGMLEAGALSLAMPDERPSDGALVSGDSADEPWRKGRVPPEETALSPTDPVASMSRVGSIAPDALVMPLPAMRITMPELPTHAGTPVNVSRPPPKRGLISGGVAAAVVATMFVVLIGGAIILFRWLMGGTH